MTPNSILCDKSLSLKAKGLWAYIQSKPEGWDFSAERISNQNRDGRDGIRAALRELEDSGLLQRTRHKDKEGKWDWDYSLLSKPWTEKPSMENPPTGKPSTEKPSNKKTRNSKKEIVKKIEGTKTKKTQLEVEIEEFVSSYAPSLIENFIDYWDETDQNGKPRWKKEKTWDLSRRLKRWKRNEPKFERRSRSSANPVEETPRRAFSGSFVNTPDGPRPIGELMGR